MTPAAAEPRYSPLWELVTSRLREFYREPQAVFWVYGFPLMMAAILGIAFQNRPMLPDCFPQAPFDAIAFDCASQDAPDREASACTPLRLPQIKHGHVRGKVTASLFVDALEIGVF